MPEAGDQHEDEEDDREREQRHAGALQQARGKAEHRRGAGGADQGQQQLALEVVERLAGVLAGDRYRGGRHHHQSQQRDGEHQRDGHRVQVQAGAAAAAARKSQHCGAGVAAHAASSWTAAANTAPR
jgi:hypothetical protein